MDVDAFIVEFRERAQDTVVPYLWSDAEILGYLNDALDEACERSRLIEDSTTAECCAITLSTGVSRYDLHASVFLVKRLTFRGRALIESSVEAEDRSDPNWESRTGEPWRFIQTESQLRLIPTPTADQDGEDIALTVYRRQLESLTLGDFAPEIAERYHQRLLDWMLHRAYSKPDADTVNPAKADEHEARFIRSFGERVDANVQRKRRDKRPHRTRMIF
jgi:hypothetical protein